METKNNETKFKNSLIDITLKNKNGFTINLNLKNPNYKKGYYVAIDDDSFIFLDKPIFKKALKGGIK